MLRDRIFTEEAIDYIIKLSEETEDRNTISKFADFVDAEIDYKEIVVIATQWHTFEDLKQANIAIHKAGLFNASRFVMLMDTLSTFIKEGRLK